MSSLASSSALRGVDAPRLYAPTEPKPTLGPKPIEFELAARIKAGDQAAVHELAMLGRPTIVNLVRWYARKKCKSYTRADLWSEAYIALVGAAKRYDPWSKPFRFSTFAHVSVRGHFGSIASRRDPLVRNRLTGERPMRVRCALASIEASSDYRDPWERSRQLLARSLSYFSPRTRHIFALKSEGLTLEEIGREIGLTKERVRQILARTIEQIQERTSNGVTNDGA
jgi:RNA polymerase sigma factor (sigma-70 family)